MDYQFLKVKEANGVATVRLNRTDARNALSLAHMRELTNVARTYRTAPHIHTVILTGTDRYFSAGADLAERLPKNETILEKRQRVLGGPDMCKAWAEVEPVTIAAIEGYCIGGGVALVTSCDFRVAGENASLRLPEVPLGINMSWRSIPRLAALMGPSRTKQFVMFGEALDANTCLDWGLVDEIAPDGAVYQAALKWAEKVGNLPPLPVRMTKEAVDAAAGMNDPAPTFMDRDQYLLTAGSNDFKEGVKSFFEKRDPEFKGN
ncbi:MAG: enoyl-CoA hydratase/isomerase family protein [Parasphingorhabdus sp.]